MTITTSHRRLKLALAALSLTLSLSAVPASAAETLIKIGNFAFAPAEITVAAGTKVTFRNDDDMIHSIVAADGSFHSQGLDTGDEFSFTFEKPGDYAYICGLHPFMQGKITVTK
jgi:plastocyanin